MYAIRYSLAPVSVPVSVVGQADDLSVLKNNFRKKTLVLAWAKISINKLGVVVKGVF